MKRRIKRSFPLIVAAYFMFGALFALFAYRNWQRIGKERWVDLAVVTAILFGLMVFKLGPDLKRPKVFVVLAGLFAGHMLFCVNFLARGVYVRPLLYVPIALVEIVISTFALIVLGGVRLEAYRNHRHQNGPQ